MAKKVEKLPELTKPKKKELQTIDFGTEREKYIANVSRKVEQTDFMTLRSDSIWWINNNIVKVMDYYQERKGRRGTFDSAEQLGQAFDMLVEVTNIINSKVRYQPQIGDFCRILGITQQTFNNWLNENTDRGEQARLIQDYFKSMLLQGMANGVINPVAGSFIGKTTLGMKEDSGNNVNVNVIATDLSLDDILSDYAKNRKS